MSVALLLILFFILFIIVFLYYIEPVLFKQKLSNNNEHGSARWATKNEIKKNFRKDNILNISKVGFPIYFDKSLNNVWFDDMTPHWCYLGSSGSGKTATSVLVLCALIANSKENRSVFITDPKGEVFSETSLMFQENGYNIITVDFRTPSKSKKINLLEPCILEYDKYIEHENNVTDIDKEVDLIKHRLTIVNAEKKYIKENKEKILKVDSQFNEIKYLNMLNQKVPILEERLNQLGSLSVDEENKSLFHYAECNRLITSISSMIMSEKESKDPFWNNSAKNLLEGIIGLFLEDYKAGKIKREQITLTSIKKFQNSSMTEDNATILKDYVESKPYGSKSKDSLLSILSSAENTYKSITSVFNEKMSIFDDINVANITSESDFAFDILGKEKTAMYIIVPDEDKTYFSLITMIVGLIYKELVKLANIQQNKRLLIPIDFILDEFANCPPLVDPSIETMVSVARSRGMRFHLYIQSFAQLNSVYGKDIAQATLDNCGLCYLKTNTDETAQTLSRMLGNTTLESNSINYSLGLNVNGSKSTNLIGRALLTPDEIKQLHYKTIIFTSVGHPVFRETVFYKKIKCYKGGCIERKINTLQKLDNTYYTVEDINKIKNTSFNMIDNTMSNQKEQLEILVEELIPELESTIYTVEYYTERNSVFLFIGFSNALSLSKINNIGNLIDENKYEWKLKNNDSSAKYGTELEVNIKGMGVM